MHTISCNRPHKVGKTTAVAKQVELNLLANYE